MQAAQIRDRVVFGRVGPKDVEDVWLNWVLILCGSSGNRSDNGLVSTSIVVNGY